MRPVTVGTPTPTRPRSGGDLCASSHQPSHKPATPSDNYGRVLLAGRASGPARSVRLPVDVSPVTQGYDDDQEDVILD